MRKQGFKLAIDDFGVGHGEMKLLCDYPVDYLKIDRHFISGIDKSPRKRHLVKNIVNMAHVLGIRVIAEGIETEAEFITCRESGVDLVQGWFIARPTTFVSELQPSYPLSRRYRPHAPLQPVARRNPHPQADRALCRRSMRTRASTGCSNCSVAIRARPFSRC